MSKSVYEDDSLNCAGHWDNKAPLTCTAMFFRSHVELSQPQDK